MRTTRTLSKRRMQLALDVPTGETSLPFSILILDNGLSFIQPDSMLLLTWNSINMSRSTPYIYPVSMDFEQKDCSGLVENLRCSGQMCLVETPCQPSDDCQEAWIQYLCLQNFSMFTDFPVFVTTMKCHKGITARHCSKLFSHIGVHVCTS